MKKIILIDGNSLMYRAYYATAMTGNLMQNSKGLYTNAIYSFANMLFSIMKDKFDNILVAFDAGKQTFRHEIYGEYKGGRSPMPEEMRMQIPYIKEFLRRIGVKQYEMPLYEADDIIGTMAKIAKQEGYLVNIYSSDKDLLQLVDDNVIVKLCKKGIQDLDVYDKQGIINRYALNNTQMIDLKALMGDASDNLKGIPGVGEKTAIKLLQEYGTLENIIASVDSIKGKLKEKIIAGSDDALMCKKMVTINQSSPILISLDDTVYEGCDEDSLMNFYAELEFHSLMKKGQAKLSEFKYKIIESSYDLSQVLLPNSALYLELDDYNYHKANPIGFGLYNELGAFYFDFDMIYQSIDFQLFLSSDNNKYVFGLKKMLVFLHRYNFELNGVSFDLLLGSYLVNPSLAKQDLKIICQQYDYDDISYDEAIYGKKFSLPEVKIYSDHIARKARAIYEVRDKVLASLTENKQLSLLIDVEMPLAITLARMEENGMLVSLPELNRQRDYLHDNISNIEKRIYEIAGYEFNISSTKQLAQLLFEELKLPSGKKTKTGYSTDSTVLEGLYNLHEIVPLILEYRANTKLLSTYVDGIEDALYPDNMVHTIFEQALTQTGRLSSIEPNLQNIPIRSELGKQIRKMFIPKNDLLFSADYSQIELRVLAHMAHVEPLIEAFNNGEDIHRKTASQVFMTDDVTPDLRRRAKAVNFGIIYGISPWGLASDLHIPQNQAKDIIDKYLETYPEISIFMNNAKNFASENGYALTILNRRRYIPEITSSNYMIREFGKRTAMNAPIQGSAADVIKLAMIEIDRELVKRKMKSQMICTVHDELIFDCVLAEKDLIVEIVKDKMENAIKLLVPLEIDYGFGENWFMVK